MVPLIQERGEFGSRCSLPDQARCQSRSFLTSRAANSAAVASGCHATDGSRRRTRVGTSRWPIPSRQAMLCSMLHSFVALRARTRFTRCGFFHGHTRSYTGHCNFLLSHPRSLCWRWCIACAVERDWKVVLPHSRHEVSSRRDSDSLQECARGIVPSSNDRH